MKIETSIILIISLFFAGFLYGQNLSQYKFLGKVNLTDMLFVSRYTFEGEIPIFKNTSLIINLGMHRKDYFYDDIKDTHTNLGILDIFPAKNILGWNTGLGMRQYLRFKENKSPVTFLEIKGTYRKSNFQDGITVSVNFGATSGGYQDHRVSGNQQLYSIYLGIGRAKIFNNKRINIETYFGVTKNFVILNACRNGCSVPSWAWPPFLNPDGSLPNRAQKQAYADEYYQSKEPFIHFLLGMKLTFLKIKKH